MTLSLVLFEEITLSIWIKTFRYFCRSILVNKFEFQTFRLSWLSRSLNYLYWYIKEIVQPTYTTFPSWNGHIYHSIDLMLDRSSIQQKLRFLQLGFELLKNFKNVFIFQFKRKFIKEIFHLMENYSLIRFCEFSCH